MLHFKCPNAQWKSVQVSFGGTDASVETTVDANFQVCILFCIQNFPVCCDSWKIYMYGDVGQKRESASFEYPNKFGSALCIFYMAKSFFNAKWPTCSDVYHYTCYCGYWKIGKWTEQIWQLASISINALLPCSAAVQFSCLHVFFFPSHTTLKCT